MMNKIYLIGMSGPNSLEDLKELIGPVKDFFDGIVWTLHDSRNSEEERYLDSVKKDGKIVHYYYHKRHNESRNQYLWCGPIKNGDWCVQIDLLERLSVQFAKELKSYIKELKDLGINMTYYFGKPFLFEYHESLIYRGSPHEGLLRQDGLAQAIELSNIFPDEGKVRLNIRPFKRKDEFGWVDHYAKYMLFPWGSNHSLLGLEKNGNPQELFPIRENRRLEFVDEMRKRGYDISLDGLKQMFSGGIDDKLKYFINNEKTWSDFYQYHILGNKSIKDTHLFSDIIKL